MNMKRNSMKFKMALCALSLLSAPAFIKADNQFINSIIVEVKNSFESVDKLYDNMVKPSSLTYDACVAKAAQALEQMRTSVLAPLAAEASAPGKSQVEQDTIKLAHELVTEIHANFTKVYKVLEAHLSSPKKNNAIELAAPLKKQLESLIAPTNLKKLKDKLTTLHGLLMQVDATTAASEIQEVIAAVQKAIDRGGTIEKGAIINALRELLNRK